MLFARRWTSWILLLMWLGSASAAETGGRVALVIGNGGYTALKTLPNPKNDAAAVARALKGLGYRLVDREGKPTDRPELDLDQQGLFRAVNALAQAAQGQEIAFLYYAGHGFQDGANSYLVPVDAPKPERADDLDILKSRSIALDRVLGKVDGKAQLMVAVFDACREIPELNTAVRASGLSGDNMPYQGLLPVYRGGIREPADKATPTSRLIAYAGAAGQLVKDGAGEHSPYTQLLLDQLTAVTRKNKNIELTEFFQQVAWRFRSDQGGRQQPLLEVAAQPGTFYLLPGGPPPGVEPPSVTTGTLVIQSSQPPGVVIYVNGGRLGAAPQQLSLPAGQQATVTVKQAGYEEYQEKVWIQAGQRMELNVTLKPLAPPSVATPTPPAPPVVTPPPVVGEPKMVSIKGGCYQMGSPASETGRESDERQHRVCVEAFEIGQREVTVGEFKRFVAAMNYRTDAEKNAGGKEGCYIAYRDGSEWKYGYRAGYSWKNPNFQQGDDHPVVCVSGNDAVAYTQWLSRQTGRTYRLPSEAEWEYAARAGTTTARYWGDDPNSACRYGNVADRTAQRTFSGWTIHECADGATYTAPVGSYQPNAWKLYDMLGNVWEWTCSVYDKEYGGAEQKCATEDTTGPLAVRGGSWLDRPVWVRSANRVRLDPSNRYYNQGFRLARSL